MWILSVEIIELINFEILKIDKFFAGQNILSDKSDQNFGTSYF